MWWLFDWHTRYPCQFVCFIYVNDVIEMVYMMVWIQSIMYFIILKVSSVYLLNYTYIVIVMRVLKLI